MSDKASLIRGAFLFCLSQTGNMTIAAEFAGTTRASMMAARGDDEGFAKAIEAALQEADDRLFYHAMVRGIKGVAMPRYYQGEIIGYVHIPSDSLLRYVLERSAGQLAPSPDAPDGIDTEAQAALRDKVRAKLAAWSNKEDASDKR